MTTVVESAKWFKCITCNSPIHRIDEKAEYDDVLIRSLHSACEIKLFTEKEYQAVDKKVTPKSHKPHIQQWFLKKARILCRIKGDFRGSDFIEMSNDAFRKQVSRLMKKGLVFPLSTGAGKSYIVKGEKQFIERGDVTLEGIGVGIEFEKILRDVSIQYPKIHNIKIKFSSTELHYFLKKSRQPEEYNQRIDMGFYKLNHHVGANVGVYPNMVEIDLSCTNEPIVYDTKGALELISILQKLRDSLIYQTTLRADDVPDCLEWTITQYHFNKDSQRTYSGEKYKVTVSEMSAGLIRFYSKKFDDGVIRVRLEQSRSPNIRLAEEVVKMIKTDNFVHDRMGSKILLAEAFEILDIHHKKKPAGGFQTDLFNFVDS